MKTFTKHLLTAVLTLVSAATILTAQTREVGTFSALSTSGSVEVKLEKADSPSVSYKMLRGDSDDLITKVKGDVLQVYIKQSWGIKKNAKAKVIVYYTELNDISASAGSSLVNEGVIESNNLEIDCSSGASAKLEIDAHNAEIGASSGASLRVSGRAGSAELDASSGASVSAADLVAKHVEAEASSGASVSCHATDSIEAEASSGGSVSYEGNPDKKEISKNRSGSVSRRG